MTKVGDDQRSSSQPDAIELSVVVPLYNEAESILEFASQLREAVESIGVSYEIIFVNDGSTDRSVELIDRLGWPEIEVVNFVANAGHMAALDAGYRASAGKYVVSLDSDLQHPPALIPVLYAAARDKAVDVVYAVRTTRERDTIFKRTTAHVYYRMMRSLTDVDVQNSAADFRLISCRVVAVIRSLPMGQQVFRLLIPSLGFASETIPYVASDRFGGESKYSLRKMVNLSTNSVVAFTIKPLTISIRLGLLVALAAVMGFVYVIVTYLSGYALEGWASVLSTVLLMFGLLFVILGVFGLYLGTILQTLMARPDYIVSTSGLDRRGSSFQPDHGAADEDRGAL